jgi:hypothetical protein
LYKNTTGRKKYATCIYYVIAGKFWNGGYRLGQPTVFIDFLSSLGDKEPSPVSVASIAPINESE